MLVRITQDMQAVIRSSLQLPAGVAVEIELVVQMGIERSDPKQNARPRTYRRPAQLPAHSRRSGSFQGLAPLA